METRSLRLQVASGAYTSGAIECPGPGLFLSVNKAGGSGTFYIKGGIDYSSSIPLLGTSGSPLTDTQASFTLAAAPMYLWVEVLTATSLDLRIGVT